MQKTLKIITYSFCCFVSFVCIVLLTNWLIHEITGFRTIHINVLSPILMEAISLTAVFLLILSLSIRFYFSWVVSCILYTAFILANVQKITLLQLPIFPTDIFTLKELFYLERSFNEILLPIIFLLAFIGFIVICLWFIKPNPKLVKYRFKSLTFIFTLIFLFSIFRNDIARWVSKNNIFDFYVIALTPANQNGYLTYFFRRLIEYQKPKQPDGYSKKLIHKIINKYQNNEEFTSETIKPNVVIFFIEAFSDPKFTVLETTREVLPTFNAIQKSHTSGKVLSPVFGGLSANSEFELLTGLSMRFVPSGEIPYIDSLFRPIPSIAHEFKSLGYQTHALHVATLKFFNYNLAYPLLGFDTYSTILGQDEVELDPAGRYPNEKSLVKAIVKKTESPEPQFIFAFPNSTHIPYNYDSFEYSKLDALNTPTKANKKKLKNYLNAIHEADKAIGDLITHYQNLKEDTIILIAGDHAPGLIVFNTMKLIKDFQIDISDASKAIKSKKIRNYYKSVAEKDPINFHVSTHQTPYLIWSNFKTDISKENTSMNLLHTNLFKLINHKPSPLFQLTALLKQRIQEVSIVIKDQNNNYQFETPAEYQKLIGDYRTLQYDILYGKGHYMEWIKSNQQKD